MNYEKLLILGARIRIQNADVGCDLVIEKEHQTGKFKHTHTNEGGGCYNTLRVYSGYLSSLGPDYKIAISVPANKVKGLK